MFNFIKIQYELGSATAEWVIQQAPKWITPQQADIILKGGGNDTV